MLIVAERIAYVALSLRWSLWSEGAIYSIVKLMTKDCTTRRWRPWAWRSWEDLPPEFQTEVLRPYYELLRRRCLTRGAKRLADLVLALLLGLILLLPALSLALLIRLTSEGPALFCQERIGRYGRHFRIYKFRTMRPASGGPAPAVTTQDDPRVTPIGRVLRRFRLDEIPQILNILKGEMSFVGTRPESPRFLQAYSPEMYATLLMPPGLTSTAAVTFKDEAALLANATEAEAVYCRDVLPQKMCYNLEDLRSFSLWHEVKIIGRTALAIWR